MDEERHYRKQLESFEQIYRKLSELLCRFGKPDTLRAHGDYSVYGDYWGYPQIKVSVSNLSMIHPRVIKLMQQILAPFPNWEFVVAITVRGSGEAWPDMGLIVRAREVIDGLQRQYFPMEFQGFKYEGSRHGTERD